MAQTTVGTGLVSLLLWAPGRVCVRVCVCVFAMGALGVQETFCSRLPQGTPATCTPGLYLACLLAAQSCITRSRALSRVLEGGVKVRPAGSPFPRRRGLVLRSHLCPSLGEGPSLRSPGIRGRCPERPCPVSVLARAWRGRREHRQAPQWPPGRCPGPDLGYYLAGTFEASVRQGDPLFPPPPNLMPWLSAGW